MLPTGLVLVVPDGNMGSDEVVIDESCELEAGRFGFAKTGE